PPHHRRRPRNHESRARSGAIRIRKSQTTVTRRLPCPQGETSPLPRPEPPPPDQPHGTRRPARRIIPQRHLPATSSPVPTRSPPRRNTANASPTFRPHIQSNSTLAAYNESPPVRKRN